MMTGSEINRRITELKLQGKKVYSNALKRFDPEGKYESLASTDSILFLERDHGVNRLNFYTNDFSALKGLVNQIRDPLTLDVVTKNEEEYQREILGMGFTLLARMRRLVNKDITEVVRRSVTPETICDGRKACLEDTEVVNRILWNTFDTRVSHLLSDEELAVAIEKGEVLIRKDHGELVTILQRSLDRHQFYINQVINKGPNVYIHSLMGKELQQFYQNGGRYLYAWVQDTNIASNRFHAKYDMKFDGLLDLVYVREK